MIVGAIRVGRTYNLGNYESKKVEIEAIPDNGQSFESLLSEVNAMVEAQGPEGGENHSPDTGKASKKAPPKPVPSSEPPFTPGSNVAAEPAPKKKPGRPAKGAKSEKSDPTATKPSTESPTTNPSTSTTTGAGPIGSTGKTTNGRKKAAVPDHEKELQWVLDSETLEEFAERFTGLRVMADAFGSVDNWEGALAQCADRYRKLNTITANPEIVKQIVAGFGSERTSIDEKRKAAAA